MAAVLAIAGGAVLAVVLFVPAAAVRYRRSGRMTTADLVALVAVPVYGLALWTYTLLPLPDPDTLQCTEAITRPFAWVDRVRDSWSGASPADLLRNAALLQVVFNVLLFVPLGALLRWRRRAGLAMTTLAGFAITLLIELTQLTGIWGLYDCSYRFFEVDDLIANTFGTVLGWTAVALVVRHRPAERPMPETVTRGRRVVGLVCDGLVMTVAGILAALAWRAAMIELFDELPVRIDLVMLTRVQWASAFLLQAVAVLGTGRTVGEWAVDVRPDERSEREWRIVRRVIRLLVGPGLFSLLAAADSGPYEVGLVAVVLLALVLALVVPSRGLGGLVSGTELVPAVHRRRARAASDGDAPPPPGDGPAG